MATAYYLTGAQQASVSAYSAVGSKYPAGKSSVPVSVPCQSMLFSESRYSQKAIAREGFTVRAAGEEVQTADSSSDSEIESYPSGEWPANFSMSNYEDLSHHYSPRLFNKQAQPDSIIADVMSTKIWTVTPESTLEEASKHFTDVSGLPVINEELQVLGVVSRKDIEKSADGLSGKVSSVMSTPAITISADKTVKDAAVLMLKNKVHRIPVVNESAQIVGIVTRTDIFTALED